MNVLSTGRFHEFSFNGARVIVFRNAARRLEPIATANVGHGELLDESLNAGSLAAIHAAESKIKNPKSKWWGLFCGTPPRKAV